MNYPAATRSISGLLLALLLVIIAGDTAQAVTRRALLVGIDRYEPATVSNRPSRWRNLSGAANDARAMRSVLVSRYGVEAENTRLLIDAEASRERILASLADLSREAEPGDQVFFYFAGHGSQQRNPSSSEGDHLDETIVPADSHAGARDIRDKELRALFGDVLDKGARLVAVFDSCSSGSIMRSLRSNGAVRYLPPGDEVVPVNDRIDHRPPPETRGALIFSAAQDGQAAHETLDDAGRSRGAFSLALLRAMREASIGEPAAHLFLRARAALMASPVEQHPVLAGGERERRSPLLQASGLVSEGVVTAAVRAVHGEEVVLDAGIAAGLNPGAELGRLDPNAAVPFRIRVTKVDGMTQSTARVLTGDPEAIRQGHLFELQRWAPAGGAHLRVALPPAGTQATQRELLALSTALQADAAITWLDDPGAKPTHRVAWDGARWLLLAADAEAIDLGATLSAVRLREQVAATPEAPARLYVSVPPSHGLRDALRAHVEASRGTLAIVESAHADYQLEGVLKPGSRVAQYAWVRDGGDVAGLPPRSDWATGAQAPAQLERALSRLTQIAAWLELESPPQGGSFPYQLALGEVATQRRIPGGVVFEGEEYRLLLHRPEDIDVSRIVPRYVYVFAIDSYGERALLFPSATSGGVENRLPRAGGPPPTSIPLGDSIRIGPPFGHDTLVMVASEQPLADPRVLEGKGIRTRRDGLDGLLGEVGRYDRERPSATPLEWSVRRVSIRSLPR